MRRIKLRRPNDLHTHLRWGQMMNDVAPECFRYFGHILWMPNPNWTTRAGVELSGGVFTGSQAQEYNEALIALGAKPQQLLSTIKLVDVGSKEGVVQKTTPDTILEAKKCGVVAAKLYPAGVTTNSADGVRDPFALCDVFDAMQNCGMVLCVHGEAPDPPRGEYCIMDREFLYLNTLKQIIRQFPRLRVVMEHVSTKEGVRLVQEAPARVCGTITAHHLYLTLNNTCGYNHHVCRPIPKKFHDREVLIQAATSRDSKFGFGSDMAPHPKVKKESEEAPCGVFATPSVAMSKLISLFDSMGRLDNLEAFTSTHLARFYGLPLDGDSVEYVEDPWTVPDIIGAAVPWEAKKTLPWRLVT